LKDCATLGKLLQRCRTVHLKKIIWNHRIWKQKLSNVAKSFPSFWQDCATLNYFSVKKCRTIHKNILKFIWYLEPDEQLNKNIGKKD
jgi:hypothetical protein